MVGTGALTLGACADSPPASTPRPPPEVTLGAPLAVEGTDHATLAHLPDGGVLVARHDGTRTVASRLGDVVLDLEVPAPTYPQATAWGGGAIVLADVDQIVVRRLDGAPVALPTAARPLYPDIAPIHDAGALVVWSELDHLRLASLLDPARTVLLPLQVGDRTGPMTLRPGRGGAVLAWSELADGFMEVLVADVDADGIVGEVLPVDRVEESLGGRPGLAVRDDGAVAVSWRGWHRSDNATAWIATFTPDGAPRAGPLQLGETARRPVLALADPWILAAWADGQGTIRLQVFDWDLIAQTEPEIASDGPDDDRPYLELVAGAGLLAWEGRHGVWVRDVQVR